MRQYQNIINRVLENSDHKGDRTGTGVRSTFNVNETFNLKTGFPIVTGKFTPFNLIAAELLWFLSGSTNNEDLRKMNGNSKPTIWEEWAKEDGELGPVYGKQWRDWGGRGGAFSNQQITGIDQIKKIINILKTDSNSRRMVISAWNVGELEDMVLEPCHYAMEFYTREADIGWRLDWGRKKCIKGINQFKSTNDIIAHKLLDELGIPRLMLSCKVVQRSCDVFLGVPFNIASYALLTHLIAHCSDMMVDELHWSGGNVHIYNNHMPQVREYTVQPKHQLPTLKLTPNCPTNINDITMDNFYLDIYVSGNPITAEVSV